jgi:hypothetical protein
MKILLRLLLGGAVTLLAACATQAPAPAVAAAHAMPVHPAPLLLISIDGFRGGSSRVDLQACKLGTGRRFTTS